MELALIINLALFGLFTGFLIVLSIDEARQEKRMKKVIEPEAFRKAA
jgi:hypothetical protein